MAQPVNMLTARPEGLEFDHWDLCGGKREDNSKSCSVTLTCALWQVYT